MEQVMDHARELLPEGPAAQLWTPYLGTALDAGIATLFAQEIIESLRYLLQPGFYTETIAPTADNLWLGAADDVIMRERGVEFVDGTAPGFAAITGAAPDVETAVKIAQELKEKMLYVFIAGKNHNTGVSFADQLVEGGVEWNGTPAWCVQPLRLGYIFSLGCHPRGARLRRRPGRRLPRLRSLGKDRVLPRAGDGRSLIKNTRPQRAISYFRRSPTLTSRDPATASAPTSTW
jgi:hypothetical protein